MNWVDDFIKKYMSKGEVEKNAIKKWKKMKKSELIAELIERKFQ